MDQEKGDSFNLHWNNHGFSIRDALVTRDYLTDCTISVDNDEQFRVHRVVLAACSPLFQSILKDETVETSSIILPDVQKAEMQLLIDFMYTGQTFVTKEQMMPLLDIAQVLQIKSLYDLRKNCNETCDDIHNIIDNHPGYETPPLPPTLPSHIHSINSNNNNNNSNNNNNNNIHHHLHHHSNQQIKSPLNVIPSKITPTVSTVTTTSTKNISTSIAQSTSSSPISYNYKTRDAIQSPPIPPSISDTYDRLPGHSTPPPTIWAMMRSQSPIKLHSRKYDQHQQQRSSITPPTSSSTPQQLLQNVAASSMLSSVYESGSDMNPLKRKKISSMLMSRDTPILRNVLAQATVADSSQTSSAIGLLSPQLTSALEQNHSHTLRTHHHQQQHQTIQQQYQQHLQQQQQHHHQNEHTDQQIPDQTKLQHSTHSNGPIEHSTKNKYEEPSNSPPSFNYSEKSYDDDQNEQMQHFPIGDARHSSVSGQQKPEWKRYKQYSRNDITKAIDCVKRGMSALQASRQYGVPSRTLYDKVKKLGITTGRPMNRTMKRRRSRSPNPFQCISASNSIPVYDHQDSLSHLHNHHSIDSTNNNSNIIDNENPNEPDRKYQNISSIFDARLFQHALESHNSSMGNEALAALAFAAVNGGLPGPHRTISSSPSSPNNMVFKYMRPSSVDNIDKDNDSNHNAPHLQQSMMSHQHESQDEQQHMQQHQEHEELHHQQQQHQHHHHHHHHHSHHTHQHHTLHNLSDRSSSSSSSGGGGGGGGCGSGGGGNMSLPLNNSNIKKIDCVNDDEVEDLSMAKKSKDDSSSPTPSKQLPIQQQHVLATVIENRPNVSDELKIPKQEEQPLESQNEENLHEKNDRLTPVDDQMSEEENDTSMEHLQLNKNPSTKFNHHNENSSTDSSPRQMVQPQKQQQVQHYQQGVIVPPIIMKLAAQFKEDSVLIKREVCAEDDLQGN